MSKAAIVTRILSAALRRWNVPFKKACFLFSKFSKVPLLASLTGSAACSAGTKATTAGFHMQLCVHLYPWYPTHFQRVEQFWSAGCSAIIRGFYKTRCNMQRWETHWLVCACVCWQIGRWAYLLHPATSCNLYCRETLGQEWGSDHKKVWNLNISHRSYFKDEEKVSDTFHLLNRIEYYHFI